MTQQRKIRSYKNKVNQFIKYSNNMGKINLSEGQFILSANESKSNEKQPDFTGEIMIDGVLKNIAGWKKEGKTGMFISGKYSEKRPKLENTNNEYGR